jgi:hypothetical protein
VGITALNIVEEFAMTEDVDEMRFGVFFLLQDRHCCGHTTRSNLEELTVDVEKETTSALSRNYESRFYEGTRERLASL